VPEMSREELLEYIKGCSPRTRDTFVQRLEGKASEKDATPFAREKLSFMEDDLTPREITLVSSRTCDCGALLSESNKLFGRAECCGALLCDRCQSQCVRCGKAICHRHSHRFSEEETYCPGCRLAKWVKLATGLLGKGVKKWFGFS